MTADRPPTRMTANGCGRAALKQVLRGTDQLLVLSTYTTLARPRLSNRSVEEHTTRARDGPMMTETPNNPPDLAEGFLRQAQSTASVAAVDDHGVAVTYGELRSLAYRFAGSIQGAASGASPRVLLALPPSPSAYAAMIGSLIAGGTFCPVHVTGPEGRNAAVCRAFCPDIILYEGTPPPFLGTSPVTRCLRRSLLIRPPLVVRTTMRASATRPRQFRRPPQTRAE